MELIIKHQENLYNLNLEQNIILFGENNSFKNSFINNIVDCSKGKNKGFLIDGNKPNLEDYILHFIDEENDFEDEFKFTKKNTFKQLIYEEVMAKIDGEKIIKYTNEIFDVIDNKVNKLIDKKINKKSDTNLSFQIEIPDINAIIDKFTNIYLNDILLNSNHVSKAMKRKLLYNLSFLGIKEDTPKIHIFIINNFDVYLNNNEIIEILKQMNKLSNQQCHFILTSSSNIFEYISLEKFNVYKSNNKIISLSSLNEAIKRYLLKREYKEIKEITFEEYSIQNENLILTEEIEKIKNMILNEYPHLMSKILNTNHINVFLSKPKIVSEDYIVCKEKENKLLFEEICNTFIDEEEQV